MRIRTVWLILSAVVLLCVLALIYVGTFRFSSPLIDPAPPTPDYGVQAVVATISVVATLVAGLGAAIYASRRPQLRGRVVAWAITALLFGNILATILAFTLSSR